MIHLHLTASKHHKHKALINADKWGIKPAGDFDALTTHGFWKLVVSALTGTASREIAFTFPFGARDFRSKSGQAFSGTVQNVGLQRSHGMFPYSPTFAGLVLSLYRRAR